MNFFRLRVLNTFLFLLVGILIGAILRDRLHRASPAAPAARYQPEYAQTSGAGPEAEAASAEAEPAAEEDEAPPARPAPQAISAPAAAPARAEERQASEITLEPDARDEDAAPEKTVQVLMVTPAQFFKKPASYAGRTVEVPLQMITVQRRKAGWRLNFVYTAADRSISYLYVTDDGSKLGDKPDLKVGYFYRVRFECGSGDAAEDNVLVSISPTGEKADWATGLSAVE